MKKKITLTLSAEVVEAIDALARYLKIPRNEVITFYLEGSTYLRKAKVSKRATFAGEVQPTQAMATINTTPKSPSRACVFPARASRTPVSKA